MKAMVFAAGEGTRLRPLTETVPKALVEVAGEPMLGRVLRSLRDAGVRHTVVNVCYLGQQVIDFLHSRDWGMRIDIADERARLLDTGGGLLAARRFLQGNEPILLHNADIITDLDLRRLNLRDDATLLVADRESSRKLVFRPGSMQLTGWVNETNGQTKGNAAGERRAFQGIHVVSPSIFFALQDYAQQIGSDIFSLTPFYVAKADRLRIYGSELLGYRWHDIGTLAKLSAATSDFKNK
ncbi:MAG: nucleotidyltransferase family protein [Bacteroides sp.]|nr:nucleotidyltransferase family protein [Bacteroides sp.]MCM1380141.1 nucleotidyltransferase family protein [Bacteroides sp.]MCM1445737.1 nucleotidyltransferase family protein [Prevotella sp.]